MPLCPGLIKSLLEDPYSGFDIDHPVDVSASSIDLNIDLESEILHSGTCGWEDPGGLIIYPGGFCLVATKESITIPHDMCARLEGRSSWARLGLTVHSTSSFVHPGFSGRIVMEMANLTSGTIINIDGSEPVSQLIPDLLIGGKGEKAVNLSTGQYSTQEGVKQSNIPQKYSNKMWPIEGPGGGCLL